MNPTFIYCCGCDDHLIYEAHVLQAVVVFLVPNHLKDLLVETLHVLELDGIGLIAYFLGCR